MNKPTYSPEISLSTGLSTAGVELLEMAGAINERCSASDFNLKRAEIAVHKAAAALAEYRRSDDADTLRKLRDELASDWGLAREFGNRPDPEAPPRFVPGSRGPHPRPSYHKQAGNGGDTPPDAAA